MGNLAVAVNDRFVINMIDVYVVFIYRYRNGRIDVVQRAKKITRHTAERVGSGRKSCEWNATAWERSVFYPKNRKGRSRARILTRIAPTTDFLDKYVYIINRLRAVNVRTYTCDITRSNCRWKTGSRSRCGV